MATTVKATKKAAAKVVSNDSIITSALEQIGEICGDIHAKSATSLDYLKGFNIADEFAQEVTAALNNPIGNAYTAFHSIGITIQALINEAMIDYFKANKNLFKKVVKAYGDNLIYTIILKRDTLSNRAKILAFLDEYNSQHHARNFEVIFSFIPAEFESLIDSENEVII